MRYFLVLIAVSLLAAVQVGAQTTDEQKAEVKPAGADSVQATEATVPPAAADITLGRIRFPRNFLQAGKEYSRGSYRVVLTRKEGNYFFDVASLKKEALFSEMGIVKESPVSGARFAYRLRQEMTSQNSFFRIKVILPDRVVMGYFQVAAATGPGGNPPAAEPK